MSNTRVWKFTAVASFEADNAEDAEAISQRLIERLLEHPSCIEAEAWCEESALAPDA